VLHANGEKENDKTNPKLNSYGAARPKTARVTYTIKTTPPALTHAPHILKTK